MATALATALISAAPAGAPEHVAEALDEVQATLAAIGQIQTDRRVFAPGTQDPRPVDLLVDNSWSALHRVLGALASLPSERYPRSAEAAALLAQLFEPERPLAFLQLRYPAEWAEVKTRIEHIESQKLEGRIAALVGPEFMAEIHRTFDLYGVVLGITTPPAEASTPDNLLEALRSLNAAINDYVVAVLSTVRRSKPGSRAAAELALEAIVRLRRAPAATPAQPAPGDPPSPPQGDTSKPRP